MRTTALLTLIATLLVWMPNLAVAQTKDSVILGWTGTNQEIVVQSKHQGEVMVEGSSKTYYFATTDMFRSKDGSYIKSYQKGELVGASTPAWAYAKPASVGQKFLDTVGLMEAVESWQSPNGRYLLASLIDTTKVDAKCESRERLVLMDDQASLAYVVHDAMKRSDACLRVSHQAFWHPGSNHFVVVRRSDGDTPWSILPRSTTAMSPYPEAPFAVGKFAEQVFLSGRPDGAVKDAWSAVFAADPARAMSALGGVTEPTPESNMLRRLVLALKSPNKSAAKEARKYYKKSPKDAYHQALLAAVQLAAGDERRGSKSIKAASKKADDYQTYAALGALFSLVDLSLSNQLLISALSHPTAKDAESNAAYVLLIRGLIQQGEFTAAEDLIAKLDSPPTEVRVMSAQLALIQRQPKKAAKLAKELAFQDSGRCSTYRMLASVEAASRHPKLALQHYRAAAFCDPTDIESLFFLGDFELRRADLAAAKGAFEKFQKRALPRRQDPVRALRLEHLAAMQPRFSHEGLVLLTTSCLNRAPLICQGTVQNTSKAPLEGVEVAALEVKISKRKLKKKSFGTATIPTIAPGETASFSVRVENGVDRASLMITAGTGKDEQMMNLTRPQ